MQVKHSDSWTPRKERVFYFIYCVCANYKCCIMPSRGPDLENKVSWYDNRLFVELVHGGINSDSDNFLVLHMRA